MSTNFKGQAKIRCAIYTRKSSEEGLDQDFNSLDAQFEACKAYILSQKHEGWEFLNKTYADGGVSGGTLERPGLKALLDNMDAGLIDMIVVYKIDRLTRSLSDFSKLVDRMDANKASFVSVTQSFNTATSMGRLTLNMLLSFAQFEREVTAERIRDKIAASKAKGLWMGGVVPLGYDPNPDKTVRGLLINTNEAKTVERLFHLYDEHACLAKVETRALEQGLIGKKRGDKPASKLSRGAIHKLLTNPIYIGQIRHKDKIFEGRHESIVDQDLWQSVQSKLQEKSAKVRGKATIPNTQSWLKGKLFDETGDHLTPSHTTKKSDNQEHIIRYYISNRLLKKKDPSGWRLSARTFEPFVAQSLIQHLGSIIEHLHAQKSVNTSENKNYNLRIEDIHKIEANVAAFCKQAQSAPSVLARLIERITISSSELRIQLNAAEVSTLWENISNQQGVTLSRKFLTFTSPMTVKRRGVEQKFVSGDFMDAPDPVLCHALAKAHEWHHKVRQGETLHHIATSEMVSQSMIRTRIRLAYLAPKIQAAILDGIQPPDLTLEKIVRCKMPSCWQKQEAMYGFK